jgi:plasmid replication initiation protein
MSLIVPKKEDYLLQHYDLSTAQYSMSLRYRKFLHSIMTQIQVSKASEMKLSFRVGDLVRAYEHSTSSDKYNYFRVEDFAKGALSLTFKISLKDGSWIMRQWLKSCEYDKKNDTLTVQIHDDLLPFVLDYKERYTCISLNEINTFRSVYAWRLYEILTTNRFFAGKRGNKKDEFFFEMSIEDIRQRMNINASKYKTNKEFRRNVITNPVDEINNSNLGLCIEVSTKKSGNKLIGFKFICTQYIPGTMKPAQKLSKERNADFALIEENQELYDQIITELDEQERELPFGENMPARWLQRQEKAIDILKKRLHMDTRTKG